MDTACSARTCVVMPVYNEEPTVAAVIDAVRAYFDGWIVVVDDGSTDGTGSIAAARDDVLLVRIRRQPRLRRRRSSSGFADRRSTSARSR